MAFFALNPLFFGFRVLTSQGEMGLSYESGLS